ncbi:unnamed protein product [Lactuca virosa]|uniref:TCP domain-containing protein n=1 Tax=Lactuca virosa TaxID=75947 RepID=A0AAU9M6X9_9ASTR|nr:unnamed protein product [Lactuca virosa]
MQLHLKMRKIVRSVGRKDKHSKICTSKGARDRRIRLSANTAIQFYDVQDRLGYDRPSNAIDWLMKEAKSAIDVLNADQYHHLQELVLPDTTTCVFNPSEAFHRTAGAPDQQNFNQDQINSFSNYPFEVISSRNENELQEENAIPVSRDINFPSSKTPLHFAWNTTYNAGESFELVNREPLQSNFHRLIVHTPNNEFINHEDGLLGFSFEQEIPVQREKEDGRKFDQLG